MTREKTLKAAVRQRMAATGEPYNVARRAVFEAVAAERMGAAGPTTAVPETAVPETPCRTPCLRQPDWGQRR